MLVLTPLIVAHSHPGSKAKRLSAIPKSQEPWRTLVGSFLERFLDRTVSPYEDFHKGCPKIYRHVVIDYNADHDYIESHEANQEPNPRNLAAGSGNDQRNL